MEKNPLGAATAIGYSSQGQIQVERNWNVVWGKVQALASRPGLSEILYSRLCVFCRCSPTLVSVTQNLTQNLPLGHSADKDPQDTPLEPLIQLLPAALLQWFGEAEPLLSSWDVFGGASPG